VAASCNRGPTVIERKVTLNVPAACAANGGGYATYYGLGDFEPTTPQAGHFLSPVGDTLSEIDARSQALVVQVSESAEAGEGEKTWAGVADVPPSGDVNVLVLPQFMSCALTSPGSALMASVGSALGSIGSQRVMLVGGKGNPPTFVADLTTGQVDPVSQDLLTPRAYASLTAFGDGALVAGGIDVGGDGEVLQTAEIYDPNLGGFDQQNALMLGTQRSEHGAVVLATGETLLVGGVGGDGTTLLDSMEVIDPVTRIVRGEGLATLSLPRRDPAVVLLASGEVFVAGGLDASGTPVSTLEWFSSDATRASSAPYDLGAAGSAQAFVALEAGGALAVVASPQDGSACSYSVWQISANHEPQAAAPVNCTTAKPVLFGGAQGAPVLWTGDRWLQWQPWIGSFGALDVLDAQPAMIGDATCSPDPGLAMWLDPSTQLLTALRFDTRNEYSTLPSDLLVSGTEEMAPDRLALNGVVFFDTQSLEGELDLGFGDSAFVTDRTYADVAIDVTMPSTQPALVVLSSTVGPDLVVGDSLTCPAQWGAAPFELHVERHGATVTWSTAAGASGTCMSSVDPAARLSIGLRGASESTLSAARELGITRLTPGAP
jgi:hypothetical protein